MNLEAIAMRRAEEQIASRSWLVEDEKPRPLRIVKPGAKTRGPKVTCQCGECRKCHNREWMREKRATERAFGPHDPPRYGRKIDPSRVCLACHGPIAVVNATGYCVGCQRLHKNPRANVVAKGRGHYSHGGGI